MLDIDYKKSRRLVRRHGWRMDTQARRALLQQLNALPIAGLIWYRQDKSYRRAFGYGPTLDGGKPRPVAFSYGGATQYEVVETAMGVLTLNKTE